jgi:hypothetical protein
VKRRNPYELKTNNSNRFLGVLNEIVPAQRVTMDDVWEAERKMDKLWWRQCRVCDFPGWTQAKKE